MTKKPQLSRRNIISYYHPNSTRKPWLPPITNSWNTYQFSHLQGHNFLAARELSRNDLANIGLMNICHLPPDSRKSSKLNGNSTQFSKP
jgi:hypothetical protein